MIVTRDGVVVTHKPSSKAVITSLDNLEALIANGSGSIIEKD